MSTEPNKSAGDSSTPTLAPEDAGKTPAKPKALWERVIAATPVVMTVLATILAGLSSGEMGRAQYYRSLAAQTQAKAGDQWAFYQAKRQRGAAVENTVDLLIDSSHPSRFDPAALSRDVPAFIERLKAATAEDDAGALDAARQEALKAQQELATLLADPEVARCLGLLGAKSVPSIPDKPIADADLKELVGAIAAQKPDEQINPLLRRLDEQKVRQAITDVEGESAAFDAATKPVTQAADKVRRLLTRLAELGALSQRLAKSFQATEIFRANADFTAARLGYESARYRAESDANLRIGRLYEASVHHYAFISDRHRVRSTRFFYGMLSAQAAVTMATIALAARERSLFWGLAAAVGLCAIMFGAYVYLFV